MSGYVSGASSLAAMKMASASKDMEKKKGQDRLRGMLVLTTRFLLDQGYLDSAERLQSESGVSLKQWDCADNIDLNTIIQEYSDFYEMKFGRAPKLTRKSNGDGGDENNINARNQKRKQSSSAPLLPNLPGQSGGGRSAPTSARALKDKNAGVDESKKAQPKKENSENSLEIGGVACKKANEKTENDDTNEFFERRLLKPLPDFGYNQEMRDLAAWITRDIYLDNPNVRWDDIAMLSDAKRLLKEAVVMPIRYPQFFTGLLSPWKGILLYGPPGTGKTMLAKAVATECKTTFFNISASSIVSKWRGDSEKLVRVLFELARYHAPSTIFLDELDSIMGQRDGADHEGSRRMKTELLIQMDGLAKSSEQVFLLAASNLPWELDTAMLRRLEKRILVPLPSMEARVNMLKKHLTQERCSELDYDSIAESVEGYSGSDIVLLCKEAAMKPVRRVMTLIEAGDIRDNDKVVLDSVTQRDVQEALASTKPSAARYAQKYLAWQKEFGSS